MATNTLVPTPSPGPFVASSGGEGQLYLWGGDKEPCAVHIYSVDTEAWMKKITGEMHPPAGLYNGACYVADQHFYLYGGSDGSSYHGALFQLDMESWSWKKLSNCSPGAPGKKSGCRMIAYKQNLVIVGGYYGDISSST